LIEITFKELTNLSTAPAELSPEELELGLQNDFTTQAVPLSHRRTTWQMTLIWITGNAGFSTLYTGYTLAQGHLSLSTLLLASIIGNVILGIYWLGASYLGSKYGHTETLLARSFMGRWGSYVVSAFIIISSLGWYSFQADLLGTVATTLANVPNDLALFSLLAGILMMFNNVVGFTSVSTYARYVAAPIIALWVLFAFVKVFATTPARIVWAAPHAVSSVTLGVAAATFTGAVIWGSEPDFWRWGQPRVRASIGPIIAAIVLGNIIFPLTGAVLAHVFNVAQFGKVILLVSQYTIGITLLAARVFFITQVAINDLNLYEVVTAAKNLFPGRRLYYVLLLGAIGAVFAYFQVINYYIIIAELTGIMVPCVTIVMMTDAWLLPRLFKLHRKVAKVPQWSETAPVNIPGIMAVAAGVLVGGFTGAIFVPSFAWGIAPLNAWVVAIVIYVGIVALVRSQPKPRLLSILGYSRLSRQEEGV
jgi:cytosine permease